ncbi:MAG: tripartite tricarboxylate transporter substrate binding protein [Alcaligenaceae bacterium]|nr:tripartite tricarboxylate transporter substrate binding protein [Alcaligenaceae bacterium SAGV5]MPS52085.1 tripartite tricarboxylate transporter substrate binding protein [Alcaligenaceae bacterium SAGV3]MPT56241.1 tripartite tricarboxylate transporter substrate binding protein [Alcaligenaceae bacterium]
MNGLKKIAAASSFGILPFLAGWMAMPAHAADAYPSRTISLVLPFSAGNGADIYTRRLAVPLSQALGQQIVIENRPGAGGVGAVKLVAAAPPDGYTLLLAGAGMPISQALFTPPPYDMLKSFVPVSSISGNDVVLLVKSTSAYTKLNDFIQAAREKKKGLMIGISQLGTTQHMAAELFKLRTGTDFTIVPFRTAAMLTTALMAGDVDLAFEFVAPTLSMMNNGQLRALAIGAAKRSPILPQVPTATEQGVPDYAVASWGMVVAPAGTPESIVARLNTEIQKVLQDPQFIRQIQESGARVLGESPQEARQMMASEVARWKEVIGAAGISLK